MLSTANRSSERSAGKLLLFLNSQEMATSTLPTQVVENTSGGRASGLFDLYFSRLTSGPAIPWNRKTLEGLFALVVVWAAWTFATWAYWGNLTVDSGHEMYVPAVLAEGKILYRDVWSAYGPAGPYLNSYLFRLFGVHLNVLYWAGSLSALGSAVFLYLVGMRLSSWLAGWTAGAVVLIQAFHPSLFCFPLPYSFSSVYGCLIACVFLWLVVIASSSKGWGWMFGAGMAAAMALLLKLEFGAACYLTLMLLTAARSFRQRGWKTIPRDLIAVLPGALICVVVFGWIFSIAGVDFILQENFMSWPTSYFMRTYGKFWLASSGFSLTGTAFLESAKRTLLFLGVLQGFGLIVSWKRSRREILIRAALFLAALGSLVVTLPWRGVLRAVFFPQDMGLYAAVAAVAAWAYFWRRPASNHGAAVALLLTFAGLLAFRIMLQVLPWSYSIYYDGPAVLSFLLLTRPLLPQPVHSSWFGSRADLLIVMGCLSVALINSRRTERADRPLGLLTTERGAIVVTQNQARQYQAAIQFMKQKNAQGEAVLSVPEDTSLYFLSGTHCPTRVYAFNPGVLASDKMTNDVIREIERNNVRYLLWSNRSYIEYGVPQFGIDFGRPLGDYFRSHYRRVGFLVPGEVDMYDWTVTLWERLPAGGKP